MLSWFSFFKGRRCQFCSKVLEGKNFYPLGLCRACAVEFECYKERYCSLCGEPVKADSLPHGLCFPCRKEPKPWASLIFYGRYDGFLKNLLWDYKFNRHFTGGRLVQQLVLATWDLRAKSIPRPDCIIPVPLHKKRLSMRGFNQSLEMSRALTGQTGIKLFPQLLTRVRNTPPQSSFPLKGRSSNVHNAFKADRAVAGKKILLTDDIMTTGNTLAECSHALLAMGALRVDILVLARTFKKQFDT